MEAAREDLSGLHDTWFQNDSRNAGDVSSGNTSGHGRENNSSNLGAIDISIVIVCMIGAPGNGMVIWLLGFRVQRNPFMTYILNLAIADLGLLVSFLSFQDPFAILPDLLIFLTGTLFLIMYSTGQFLLTAISIDRCVAVFFPLWHRCHRPPRLSTIVCALMWVLSFLQAIVTYIAVHFDPNKWAIPLFFQVLVNVVLCLPLTTVSTLALFIKVCFKPRQHRRGKLFTILLLTLAFFLLFAFPLNVILIIYMNGDILVYVEDGAILLACLNSSVNPVIYFLVGRQRKTRRRESLKMILQRAFKEEEGHIENTHAETQF